MRNTLPWVVVCLNVSIMYPIIDLTGIFLSSPHVERLYRSVMRPKKLLYLENSTYAELQRSFLWHQTIATTGLVLLQPPPYPFLPHYFSLGELAPARGKNICVVFIDTGVSCFASTQSNHSFHPCLTVAHDSIGDCMHCGSSGGFDALVQYAHKRLYGDTVLEHEFEFEQEVMRWISEYVLEGTTKTMTIYLTSQQISDVSDKQGALTPYGNTIITELTTGPRGIMPRGKPRFFSSMHLVHPICKDVVAEFLPSARLQGSLYDLIRANHGNHMLGIVAAHADGSGPYGIAPHAHVIMIKACNDKGITTPKTLLQAVRWAQKYKPDIINLSLALEYEGLPVHDNTYEKLAAALAQTPYVIAADAPYMLPSVTLTIGAFSYDYTYSAHTNNVSKRKPTFLAPGHNILSTGVLPTIPHAYFFVRGTSPATALMSGFMAVILSEFKNDVTKDQILAVLQCASISLKNQSTSHSHSHDHLKIVDMRTALFILHVCKQLRSVLPHQYFVQSDLFNTLIAEIHTFLYAMPRNFAQQHKIQWDMVNDFKEFYATCAATKLPISGYYTPKNASDAIMYVVDSIAKKYSKHVLT